MLKEELIPTPLLEPSERAPVTIAEPRGPVRFRGLWVLSRFLRWFLGDLWLRVRRQRTPEVGASRLRALFEELGFLWIKLGQVISLRSDILSPEVCDQLSQLQYQAFGFSPAVARRTVEEEMGRPMESVFDAWEEMPFAAASIAQVHKAHLREENLWVAVKVQRPDAPWVFKVDMALLRKSVVWFKRFRIMPYLRWDELVWELEQIMLEEIDYRYEAANLRRMRKSLRRHKVYVPRVFESLSARRVLVMEFLEGTLMSDYIEVARKDPGRLAAWQEENNVDPRRVGNRLFETFFRQLLEDNLFHADLHPGNIVLLRDSRVALIDFGTVGTMETEFLARYLLSFQALSTRQYAKAADLTLLMCPELPRMNIVQVKEKIVRAYRAWEMRTNLRNLPYHEKSIGNVGMEVAQIMYDAGAATSWSFMKISRTWGAIDASLNYLIPDVNYRRLFQRYFRRATERALAEKSLLQRVSAQVEGMTRTVSEYSILLGPLLREQVMTFEGAASKGAFIAGQLFRLGRRALVVALAVLGLGLLWHFYPRTMDPVLPEAAEPLLNEVPRLSRWAGIAVLLLGIYLFRFLGRLQDRLLRQELPANAGQG